MILPTKYEGFGLPPLEAMAPGRPVVVSDTSSFPELYQGAAVLVELGSPLRLAEAIDQISSDEGRQRELIDRGLKKARLELETQLFCWNPGRIQLFPRPFFEVHFIDLIRKAPKRWRPDLSGNSALRVVYDELLPGS